MDARNLARTALLATLAIASAAAPAVAGGEPTPVLAAAAASAPTAADDGGVPAVSARRLHLDLEVDPTAYVMGGYSLHLGVGWKRVRLDLGTYAMDVPELLHGNEGWDASFAGGGIKAQLFPFTAQRGVFVDVGLGVSRRTATLVDGGAPGHAYAVSVGASAGYRFWLPYGLYATPWAGLDVDLDDASIASGGRTFTMSRVTPFAAVHLGYRFR